MENFNRISINSKYITINAELLSYKKKLFLNNINSEHKYKINTINPTISDSNDNEENIINTDSTLDTDKTKYIYKKKINFTKNRLNFHKTRKCKIKAPDDHHYRLKTEFYSQAPKNESPNLSSSSKYLMNIKKIKNKNNLDNYMSYNINITKLLNTSNNFYKRNKTIDAENKMNRTNSNFYKKRNNTFEEDNKKEKININNNNYMKNSNINNNINIYINIEKLITFEEKFKNLINSINSKKNTNINNECLVLINYFYNSSIFNKLEIYFNKNTQSKLIINKSIKLIIFSAILAYYISFDESFINTCLDYLATIININHKSYLLLCEQIINKINDLNKNILIDKLFFIVKNNLFHIDINDKDFFKYLSARKVNISKKKINFIHEIKYYSFLIHKYIKVLLKNLNNNGNKKEELTKIFNNIKDLSFQEINSLFLKNIKKKENIDISIISKYTPTDPEIKPPYIKTSLTKKFSLVLDLDETLISLERKKLNLENKGILKFRPGLLKFLTKVKKYYEIIIFTSGTREYGEQILDAIENGKNYFDFKLFREHTLFYNNEFIKDISRIGRPLDKIIIVDNMPQNYRLQKENGIEIKPFYGEDNDDKALDYLGSILRKIVNKFDDVRDGILEFKNEIKNKISNCL